MSQDWYQDVKDFHEKFELHCGDKPSVPNDGEKSFRIALIEEEIEETFRASTASSRNSSLRETAMPRRATRLLSACFVALQAVTSVAALAAVDDDFRAASAAYRSGDMNTAIKTLLRGSDAGHVPSMLLRAYIYEQASFDSQAVAMYQKAVAAGSTDGEVGLAGMLAAGKGVPRNTSEAMRLYESASAKGNPTAISALAQAYISGSLGLVAGARDDAKALEAIRRAAGQGYAPARWSARSAL